MEMRRGASWLIARVEKRSNAILNLQESESLRHPTQNGFGVVEPDINDSCIEGIARQRD